MVWQWTGDGDVCGTPWQRRGGTICQPQEMSNWNMSFLCKVIFLVEKMDGKSSVCDLVFKQKCYNLAVTRQFWVELYHIHDCIEADPDDCIIRKIVLEYVLEIFILRIPRTQISFFFYESMHFVSLCLHLSHWTYFNQIHSNYFEIILKRFVNQHKTKIKVIFHKTNWYYIYLCLINILCVCVLNKP